MPLLDPPTQLLWGDADLLSPVGVLPGGTHDLAIERAERIAPLIDRHLSR